MEGFLRVLQTDVLDLARTAAGSGGVWEMIGVVEEEEIGMEDEYEEEEEARRMWMMLFFLALLVMVWSESDEVNLHQ